MAERRDNPFLPKRRLRWQLDAAEKALSEHAAATIPMAAPTAYAKGTRGRKPKDRTPRLKPPEPLSVDEPEIRKPRQFPFAGRLNRCSGTFEYISNAGWGTATDLLPLAHGPVGCGAFTQSQRFSLPGDVPGLGLLSELHACTDLDRDTLREDGGDAKLGRAMDEAFALFPLARGAVVLNEDAVRIADSNPRKVADDKSGETGRFVALPGVGESLWREFGTHRRAAARLPNAGESPTDVALTFMRRPNGLALIVAQLLGAMGLNVIHQCYGTSLAEMGRIPRCRLSIGFAPMLDVPLAHLAGGAANNLRQWFGIPIQWTCFSGPSATEASLRRVAAHFDASVQARALDLIEAGRARVAAAIARYRPRLEGKLLIHIGTMTPEQLEPFRLLGLRIGNCDGWPGERGRWRTPRLICDRDDPSEKSIDALLAEAKPDLVLHAARDEWEWRKRGHSALRETPLCDGGVHNLYWGFDGFALLAAALDRHMNAPWRKLQKPPWPNSG